MTRSMTFWCAAGWVLASGPVLGADATAGKSLFRERCIVCHTAESGDNGGAQGPSLIGIMGRAAAAAPQFSYTAALRDSKLTWDAASLSRFLASPTTVVPGTSMVVAVPDDTERDNLIAYFQSVANQKPASPETAVAVPASSVNSANWRLDAPGQTHRITANSLPPPFATNSSRNNSSVVAKPAIAALSVPPGFHIDVFSEGLTGPRKMLVAPNGDILVTEMRGGRVSVLHPSSDGIRAAGSDVLIQGLRQPFGLAFYPNAQNPQWLYVAETNRVTRYPYQAGDVKARGAAQVVVAELPSGVGHSTRDIAFSPDGKRLFVSVGSGSNVAETMSKKKPEEIKSWEAVHGLGGAWDVETNRAAVLEFDAAAPAAPSNYANGIRNCVSLTVQPANGALWCTTNERDALGDDLVPDYSTRVARGAFYGWPWYYVGSNEDPRLKGDRPDLNGKVSVPDVLYQSHSAALSMTFYEASHGKSAFPAAFVGDAFVGFHGSWNRSLRTGYKLVRVHMKNGEPTGDYDDFLTGFVVDDAHVWGRPVATVELPDGSLLLSEDGNNVIFRISYSH
ncbi:MAG TPA: PQQ-dependent sugar dehydrogenase [Steroidobacteraceae bacterium]|nr:PQQ-dependent sugar dehydrogenase [Steroidobacteraceae bacterium]